MPLLLFASKLSAASLLVTLSLGVAVSQVVGVPVDIDQATNPRTLLRDDRQLAFIRGLIVAPVSGVVTGLIFAQSGSPVHSFDPLRW
ncbi:hypothetical protein AB0425_23950 [Actinosynnema sp. NPDC051121]